MPPTGDRLTIESAVRCGCLPPDGLRWVPCLLAFSEKVGMYQGHLNWDVISEARGVLPASQPASSIHASHPNFTLHGHLVSAELHRDDCKMQASQRPVWGGMFVCLFSSLRTYLGRYSEPPIAG